MGKKKLQLIVFSLGAQIVKSNRGFTLVEILVALSIFLIVSLGAGSSFYLIAQQKKQSELVHSALLLYNSAFTAIRDPENFNDQLKSHLYKNDLSPSLIKIDFHSMGPSNANPPEKRLLFTLGQAPSYFDQNNNKIQSTDITAASFALYSALKIDTSGPIPTYRIGIRIVFLNSDRPPIGPVLVDPINPNNFSDNQFWFQIPEHIYSPKTFLADDLKCDPDYFIAINGFNKKSGAPHCILKYSSAPQTKAFPDSIEFYSGSYSGANYKHASLDVRWQSMKKCTPPENYLFNSIDTSILDPRFNTGQNTYVFIYKKNVPFFKAQTGANKATASCPKNFYRAQGSVASSCSMQITAYDGTCQDSVGNNYSCAPDCSPGPLTYLSSQNQGTCTFTPKTCPNGGGFEAQVTITPSDTDCTLTVPETISKGC